MTDKPVVHGGLIAPAPRLSSIVARLSVTNMMVALGGFITGPLLARALGPSGRGELAAIVVPFVLAPQVFGLALGAYAAREVASGRRSVRELAGSVGLPLVLIGGLGTAGALPAAHALATGNETVEKYLVVAFLLLPLGLLAGLGMALLGGLERWTLVIVTKLIPVGVPLFGTLVLYVMGAVTVGRVAVLTFIGAALSAVPAFVVMARAGRPVVRATVAIESIRFSVKAWVGFLAQLTNARLDQLLMIALVSPRALGLYTVAVALAGISSFLSGALGPPLITRVAQGDTAIVARGLRVTLAAITAMNLAVGAATPIVLPLLFGSAFKDAVPQALVLLAASIPLAGISLLAPALMADGAPGKPSVGETIALAITVPGLLLLVPLLEGMGAALVSLAAYTANFVYQLVAARRRLGGPVSSYLLLRRQDLRWARSLLPAALGPR